MSVAIVDPTGNILEVIMAEEKDFSVLVERVPTGRPVLVPDGLTPNNTWKYSEESGFTGGPTFVTANKQVNF